MNNKIQNFAADVAPVDAVFNEVPTLSETSLSNGSIQHSFDRVRQRIRFARDVYVQGSSYEGEERSFN